MPLPIFRRLSDDRDPNLKNIFSYFFLKDECSEVLQYLQILQLIIYKIPLCLKMISELISVN